MTNPMKALADNRAQKAPAEKPVEFFLRVKQLRRPGDHFPASCVEVLKVQGQRILKRIQLTKPDTLEMTLARLDEAVEMGEAFDPDKF